MASQRQSRTEGARSFSWSNHLVRRFTKGTACRLLLLRFARVRRIVDKVPKIHDDTLRSLLDRIGLLREELVSIEHSLERMKAAGNRWKGTESDRHCGERGNSSRA